MSGKERWKTRQLLTDFRKLEEDLQAQIKDDELYWLRNDAKLRAVTQGAPTYEDFRQLVLAAHLKPVSKEEKEELQRKSMGGKVIWNSLAEENSGMAEDVRGEHENAKSALEEVQMADFTIPKTNNDFVRAWKALSETSRKFQYVAYLVTTEDLREQSSSNRQKSGDDTFVSRSNVLKRICAEEFPPEIFHELIHSISVAATAFSGSGLDAEDQLMFKRCKDILCVLLIISESKRFNLSISLLDPAHMMLLQKTFLSFTDLIYKDIIFLAIHDLFFQVQAKYIPHLPQSQIPAHK